MHAALIIPQRRSAPDPLATPRMRSHQSAKQTAHTRCAVLLATNIARGWPRGRANAWHEYERATMTAYALQAQRRPARSRRPERRDSGERVIMPAVPRPRMRRIGRVAFAGARRALS